MILLALDRGGLDNEGLQQRRDAEHISIAATGERIR
jgi:hypothetical protein